MNGNSEHKKQGKSTLDDALDRMVSVATTAAGDRPAFIPSAGWQGSKEGYYFGTTERGTGYHLDTHQQQEHEPSSDATSAVARKKRKRPQLTAQEMLEEAEQAVDPHSKVLDLTPKGVRGACVALRKISAKNQLQRAKHADDPQQFMESELALHQQISALGATAASTALYATLLEEDILQDFLVLLAHENSDVALTVVHVLQEWLDSDSPSPAMMELHNALLTEQVLKASVDNLGRLDPEEEEDAVGIEDIMTLVENMVELDLGSDKASAATHLVEQTSIVPWLFQQISTRQSGRAAEVLSLLLQQPQVDTLIPDLTQVPPYTSPLLEDAPTSSPLDGMEILLQAIATYRKSQPSSEDECDFLENCCLALASALTFSPVNITKFLEAQGVELVLRCLKEKVHAGGVALKLLDLHSQRASEHIVEAGGLKYLFPLFVGRSIPKPMQAVGKKARKEWLHMLETQTILVIYTLTRFLTLQSRNDAMARVLVKFAEDDCLKCNRLVELLLKYDQKARVAEYNFYRSTAEEDDDVELAGLHAKLKGGGDLFHRLGAIAAFCCVGSKKCHAHILDQLTLQKSGIGVVKSALEEFISVLDDGDQKQQLQRYLELI